MWKDPGVSGDAQRLEQLGWMITLKIIDDKEAELELLNDDYVSVIPSELQWEIGQVIVKELLGMQ